MSKVRIFADVETQYIVEAILYYIKDRDSIIDFILSIDLAVADRDFTVKLRDRLSNEIDSDMLPVWRV